MYVTGEGVIEDDAEAYAWFNVAATNGSKEAAEYRDEIKKVMTSEQIAEGQKRSREIMESIIWNPPNTAIGNLLFLSEILCLLASFSSSTGALVRCNKIGAIPLF